jgi:hypothetical protein
MSASVSDPAGNLPPEEARVVQYRAVSRAALAALALGIASAAALISPILVVVPLAAVVAGLVALRTIQAGGGLVVGRWLATAGICLALLLGSWGVVRHFSRQMALADQAIRLADGWLELVRRGQREAAHQLTLRAGERMSSLAAAEEYYRTNIQASDSLARYFESEPLKSFVTAGPEVQFRLDSVAQQVQHTHDDEIALKYTFDGPDGRRPMWIVVVREVDEKTGRAAWDIRRVQADPPQGVPP